MSDQDVKIVSSATGQFAALQQQAGTAAPEGNAQSGPGETLPDLKKPDLEALANKMNIASRSLGRDLRFQVNLKSGESVIQVLDSETGEIIRQIPPEEAKAYVSDKGSVALRLYDDLV